MRTSGQGWRPGAVLTQVEKKKLTSYGADLAKHPRVRFVPFAVDDFGHIGSHGLALLAELAAQAVSRAGIMDAEPGAPPGAPGRRATAVSSRVDRWLSWIAAAVHSRIALQMVELSRVAEFL